MTKRERAAALIKDFPDLRQEDIDRCMAQMPHHILFRHDRSECRCNYCGSTLTAETHSEYLTGLVHDTKTHCPECGEEGFALCDSYNYSNTVGRGARNFVIFAKGEGDICYAYCVRICIRLDREIGGFAVEDYDYTETQRYVFTEGFAYRYGRDNRGYYDPLLNCHVDGFSPWTYREKYTEPTWEQSGFYSDRSYYPLNEDEVDGTCLQYAQLGRLDCIALFRYIGFYLHHPNVEHLIKQGFEKMVAGWFRSYAASIPRWIDWKQSDVRKMLGVNAYELRKIHERQVDIEEYRRIREELPWLSVDERFVYLNIVRYNWGFLSVYSEDVKHQRELLKYIRKQNEKYAVGSRCMTLRDYRDYRSECRELQYDWSDRMIRFPRCLAEAHSRTSDAVNAIRREAALREEAARAEDRRIQELKTLEQKRRNAEKLTEDELAHLLREKLGFDNGTLSVCVPASAAAIVDEGRALHHCVGGYAERHVTGALHILFIRRDSAPNKPYFTMEVSTEGVVIQVRGLRNCPPPDEVKQLVESYKNYIRPLFAKQRKVEKVRVSA